MIELLYAAAFAILPGEDPAPDPTTPPSEQWTAYPPENPTTTYRDEFLPGMLDCAAGEFGQWQFITVHHTAPLSADGGVGTWVESGRTVDVGAPTVEECPPAPVVYTPAPVVPAGHLAARTPVGPPAPSPATVAIEGSATGSLSVYAGLHS